MADPDPILAKRRWDLASGVSIAGFTVASLCALGIVGTTLTLVVLGRPVPTELWQSNATVLGFLFGTVVGTIVGNTVKQG